MKLPADVRAQLARRFLNKQGEWLAADAPGGAEWPLRISLGAPSEETALGSLPTLRQWIGAWRDWSGPGELLWRVRNWNSLGSHQLPYGLLLHSPEDVAAWLGEDARFLSARARALVLSSRWPKLAARMGRYYTELATYAPDDFVRLQATLSWLEANPRSGLYLRQIPIEGLDTKWIEARQGIVADLVATLQDASPSGDLYALCGLRRLPHMLRMRILDPALRSRVGGLHEFAAPLAGLQALDLRPSTVYIVENLQCAYAMGDQPGSVVLAGLGYAVDVLGSIDWVADARVIYWGDIDTHGLAILDRARARLPRVASVMMDAATLERFNAMWVREPLQHAAASLDRLTPDEEALYRDLKAHRWGQNIRLEQERIEWEYACHQLEQART